MIVLRICFGNGQVISWEGYQILTYKKKKKLTNQKIFLILLLVCSWNNMSLWFYICCYVCIDSLRENNKMDEFLSYTSFDMTS